MKKKLIALALLFVVVHSCDKQETIDKDGFLYNYAKALALKVPEYDPDVNSVLVRTKSFEIRYLDVLQSLYDINGRVIENYRYDKPSKLRSLFNKHAESLATKRLLLERAEDIVVTDAEVDSAFHQAYQTEQAQRQFKANLKNLKISKDRVFEEIRSGLLINKHLEQQLEQEITVTEEEVLDIYNNHTATVRHILIKSSGPDDSLRTESLQKIESLLARARNGEDFAALAKQYSEDEGSKKKGGLYENFPRGMMVKPFEDAAFSVPVGEISDVVETVYGFHIILVLERMPDMRPFDEVSDSIRVYLRSQKLNRLSQDYIEEVKKEDELEVVISS